MSVLNALHEALASQFAEILEGGDPTAAELNTIRQFLKDNDVTLIGMLDRSTDHPVIELASALPFVDPEEGPIISEVG